MFSSQNPRSVSRRWTFLYFIVNFVIALTLTTRGDFRIDHRDPVPIWNQADGFFRSQISAWFEGHIWVDPAKLTGECFFHNHQCFSYFGFTPSLLRLLFLPILNLFNTSGTSYFLALGIALSSLAFWLILDGLILITDRFSLLLRVWGAVLVGPISFLFFATRSSIYHEALIWTICFASFVILYFMRWITTRSDRNFRLMISAAVLSAGVQPSVIPSLLVIAAGTILFSILYKEKVSRTLVLISVLILASCLVCFGTFFIKFGTPIFDGTWHQDIPETPYWAQILKVNGGRLTGISFIPSQLYSIFRVDGLTFLSNKPWIGLRIPYSADFKFLWPIKNGGMAVVAAPSATDIFPLQVISLVICFAILPFRLFRKNSTRSDLIHVVAFLAGIAFVLISLMQVQVASRYLTYLYLPTSLAVIFVLHELSRIKQKTLQLALHLFIIVGLIWTTSCLYCLYLGGV